MSGDEVTTVCAVVLTHNRCAVLEECLDRLERQSRPPDQTLVVDNASRDGTATMLDGRPAVEVLRLPENLGAAGGFAAGIRAAHARDTDWIWLLDDDTLVDETCLEALLDGARRAPRPASVLSSVVRWRDSSLHPMNVPVLRLGRRADFAAAAAAGLVAIRAASWVSTMVRHDAVTQHGLPPAHYFVWLEDIEYTGRILREGTGYWVPESTATHATARPVGTSTGSGERFYFKARNQLWILRGPAFQGFERLVFARSYLRSVATYMTQSEDKPEALRTVARGVRDGLRREPT